MAMFPDVTPETLSLALEQANGDAQLATDFLLRDADSHQAAQQQQQQVLQKLETGVVFLTSETEFPALGVGSGGYEPPREVNLGRLAGLVPGAKTSEPDVASVEWVEYLDDSGDEYDHGDDEFEEVRAADAAADFEEVLSGSSVIMVEPADNWDVVSQTSEMSFLEVQGNEKVWDFFFFFSVCFQNAHTSPR